MTFFFLKRKRKIIIIKCIWSETFEWVEIEKRIHITWIEWRYTVLAINLSKDWMYKINLCVLTYIIFFLLNSHERTFTSPIFYADNQIISSKWIERKRPVTNHIQWEIKLHFTWNLAYIPNDIQRYFCFWYLRNCAQMEFSYERKM